MNHQHSIDKNIFHDCDHLRCKARLDSLYGLCCDKQNLTIIKHVIGERILDVGAGYGNLVAMLEKKNYIPTGIEPNKEKRELAKTWYEVNLVDGDIYDTNFPNREFDCVILREIVFHLDFEKAFGEISRICKGQIIIFQGNTVFFRKIGQFLFGHKEFNEQHREYYIDFLKHTQFKNIQVSYCDTIAFPLSGGFIGKQLVPKSFSRFMPYLLKIDGIINSMLKLIHLQKYFCFRFIIVANRE